MRKFQGIFLFISLLLIPSTFMAATSGKIAGQITDAETGDPLAGADVQIEGTTMGATVDATGYYFILNVKPGTYTVMASMMGYTSVSKTEVRVSVDRTITVDFELSPATLEGEEVTVVAARDIVKLDVSASQMTNTGSQMKEVPTVIDIGEFISLQAGVDGDEIRGGGPNQTGLLIDGLTAVDNVHNEPLNIVNLSAVEEVNVIKGGFNAEYGNIRSGLINVVTKEGGIREYNGSIDFQYTVPHQKHRGASIYSMENYYLRSYLDPAVCWTGTKNGPWNKYTQGQFPEFEGWNSVSNRLLADDDPENDATPEELRNLFIWQHRADGSAALGHPHPGEYGKRADTNFDVSFGGPVPLIGDPLGNLTFFTSFRDFRAEPQLPAAVDYLHEQNFMLKFTSILSPTMKFSLEGIIGKVEDPGGGELQGEGEEIGEEGDVEGAFGLISYERGTYFAHGMTPRDIYRNMYGIVFDHAINRSTFYNVRLSLVTVENNANFARTFRNTSIINNIGKTYGTYPVDETPWGYTEVHGYQYAYDQMVIGGVGAREFDKTKGSAYNFKFDITSQINKFNQVKSGLEVVYDNMDVYYGEKGLDPTGDFTIDWEKNPIRAGAYVQDKLEYQGMIANIGLRLDYNNPNTNWYSVDPYSKYFSRQFKSEFDTKTPTEPAKNRLRLAPRLGVSHPITVSSKLYFNYGHFFQLPTAFNMYQVNYGRSASGIYDIGNANLQLPRTISYELGYEHELGDMFLISLAGYYKDVTDQTSEISYANYDGSVDYITLANQNYADIRGFELSLEKRWGDWVTGWFNYNYMVITSGHIGREAYFQDPREQAIYGLRNPEEEKPLPQPFARANMRIMSPEGWGPTLGTIHPLDQLSVALLFQYSAGDYFTWDVAPFTADNNVQWKSWYNFDMRIAKRFNLGRYEFSLFADIYNVFDIRYLTGAGFRNEDDYRDYMNSLHLPIYEESKFKNQGYIAGDDKPGDVWSEDKPYINMPNIDFAAWNLPRSIVLGLRLDF